MQQHAIVIADQNGVIQLWSDGAATLIGYSREDAVGQKLDLVVPPEFREQHWHGFGNAMKGGALKSTGTFFDLPVRCRNGDTRTLRGQLHVLRSETNGPIGAMAIFTSP
ncbi:MAG TPA: PAS domain S-box protein [Pseudolabrys sp.]|jgi:PAS domain S-box-containing protein|nr:PAS domain S-box protein [Pseudolabrys sp.]